MYGWLLRSTKEFILVGWPDPWGTHMHCCTFESLPFPVQVIFQGWESACQDRTSCKVSWNLTWSPYLWLVALRWTPSAMVDKSQSCSSNVSSKVELKLRSFSGDGALRRRRLGGEGGCWFYLSVFLCMQRSQSIHSPVKYLSLPRSPTSETISVEHSSHNYSEIDPLFWKAPWRESNLAAL